MGFFFLVVGYGFRSDILWKEVRGFLRKVILEVIRWGMTAGMRWNDVFIGVA